jgi:hypothetical protein
MFVFWTINSSIVTFSHLLSFLCIQHTTIVLGKKRGFITGISVCVIKVDFDEKKDFVLRFYFKNLICQKKKGN